MKKDKIDSLLGRQVIVTLFDGTEMIGELHRTGEERFKKNLSLYLPNDYYVLINPHSCLFKSSHITKAHAIARDEGGEV